MVNLSNFPGLFLLCIFFKFVMHLANLQFTYMLFNGTVFFKWSTYQFSSQFYFVNVSCKKFCMPYTGVNSDSDSQ